MFKLFFAMFSISNLAIFLKHVILNYENRNGWKCVVG